ncbi:MAG: hypothetical protein QXL09_02040 [Candidatus Aenigmatarchaeota archaeon]
MIQKYEQTTCESCLAVNLLNLIGVEITPKIEKEVLYYALEFSKYNFVIGHLDFIANKFNVEFDFYIDNRVLFILSKNLNSQIKSI